MNRLGRVACTGLTLLLGAVPAVVAQTQDSSPANGKVIFSRGQDAVAAGDSTAQATQSLLGSEDPLGVTRSERSALRLTSYELDVHLTPASSAIGVRAVVVVQNDSVAPLSRVVLQISSTLHWDAISADGKPLPVGSRLVETDADHTGAMDEAVVTLAQPLAPGQSITVTALYSGVIELSAERLVRAGAPAEEARASDWDQIASDGTALRGFGHVLWYPVSAPPMFFREGSRLFDAIGAARLRDSHAQGRLRLAVEYQGEPPDSAWFAGRHESLKAISDNPDAPIAEARGIATATFGPETIGFRTPDLFVTSRPPVLTGTIANPDLLSIFTTQEPAIAAYSTAASGVESLLTSWYGAHPESPLFVIDHAGQPYEDGTLLLRSLAAEPAKLDTELAHSLTHAWIRSSQPWIDEGLAEFSRLLWLERTRGRDAALAALMEPYPALARAETSGPTSGGTDALAASSSSSSDVQAGTGQTLVSATSEVFYRTKAAAVWWMLRAMLGDQAMQQALQAYRSDARANRDAQGLERILEKFSHKDLQQFFDDWVYYDRGLPRLSIVSVAPGELKGRTGMPDGWLVAVEVRNDGGAVAEVPVTVRSAIASQTQRLRVGAHSTAVTRIVFAGTPDEVLVNDGSVPDSGPPTHTRQLKLPH